MYFGSFCFTSVLALIKKIVYKKTFPFLPMFQMANTTVVVADHRPGRAGQRADAAGKPGGAGTGGTSAPWWVPSSLPEGSGGAKVARKPEFLNGNYGNNLYFAANETLRPQLLDSYSHRIEKARPWDIMPSISGSSEYRSGARSPSQIAQ
jgi:hypothetical protein